MNDLISNLIFVWHMIRASEDLLIQAASRASGPLKEYYKKHLEEERGHAVWLAEDLRSVGVDVQETPIPLDAMQMVGCIYYLILHGHPAALLGYMKVLESWPMPEEKIKEYESQFPESLLRTLKHHATHDPVHIQDIMEEIRRLVPSEMRIAQHAEHVTRHFLHSAMQRYVQTGDFSSNGLKVGQEAHATLQ